MDVRLYVDEGWRVSPMATGVAMCDDNDPYYSAPHLKALSDAIVDGVTGRGSPFIIASMPPRHGKSQTASRWTPEWFLSNWPNKHVIVAGYGKSFAAEWGRTIRNDITRIGHRLGISLAQDSQDKSRWHTSRGGGLLTGSIGSGITGFGGDLAIIDDPVKNDEEASSSTYREDVWQWWNKVIRTRLHPGAVVVIIMTRWHEDDLVGRLLNPKYSKNPGAWRVLNFPAVHKEEFGPCLLGRRPGQALWPWRYDEAYFKALDVTEDTWEALYQQRPRGISGVGRVYHGFSELNVRACLRDPALPLAVSMDFNLNPMSWAFAQHRAQLTHQSHLTNEMDVSIDVLGELSLPDSNTPEALEELDQRLRDKNWVSMRRPLRLQIHGDSSGNQRVTSSAGSPTDYDTIRKFFAGRPGYQVRYCINKDNPAVKDRVSAVNLALKTLDGRRRLMIDPACIELIDDMKHVRWKRDSAGLQTNAIDKGVASRTHMSDALGYYVWNITRPGLAGGERADLLR